MTEVFHTLRHQLQNKQSSPTLKSTIHLFNWHCHQLSCTSSLIKKHNHKRQPDGFPMEQVIRNDFTISHIKPTPPLAWTHSQYLSQQLESCVKADPQCTCIYNHMDLMQSLQNPGTDTGFGCSLIAGIATNFSELACAPPSLLLKNHHNEGIFCMLAGGRTTVGSWNKRTKTITTIHTPSMSLNSACK